jgi:hypothetical protein
VRPLGLFERKTTPPPVMPGNCVRYHVSRGLARCANVHAVRSTSQESLPNEREEDDTTGLRVQTPEPSRLSFRQLQTWHLAVFAFDSSDQRRPAAARLAVEIVFA